MNASDNELRYVRATAGFFVARRGVVNPGEVVQLPRGEAFDVVAASRGVVVTAAEAQAGPMADFKPKDAEGNAIQPDRRTRAQIHAAMRAQQRAAQ
jgi:hypothetical protein